MYVVGQYPRFLRAHWKFLKTVVFKLFEFMHETFPGVQEMACDTFLKIGQKCKKKFAATMPNEQKPFIEEMAAKVQQDISDLEHLHICTYFEAVGHMISAAPCEARPPYVNLIMGIFNEKWIYSLAAMNAAGPAQYLDDQSRLRELSLILRVNERMVSAVGAACHVQLSNIYFDMLKLYKVCSDFISHTCSQQGAQAMAFAKVRLMRNVKRDTLRLVATFVQTSATDQQAAALGLSLEQLTVRFIPPLLEPVLADYRGNPREAKDAEVLDLLATLAEHLSDSISQEIAKIFEMVFECTLDMIKGDFQSYPDHRAKFYNWLKTMNKHCFQALFSLADAQLKLYVESLIWAFKHEQPQVADVGLQILQQFVERLLSMPPHIYKPFFGLYYYKLMQDVLSVLTDTLHKAGFKLQQHILLLLIHAVESGLLTDVISKEQVMEFLFKVISQSFPTLHKSQVEIFVLNSFSKCRQQNEFQQHLRDFLIQLREWGSHEDALYESERQEALAEAKNQENQWRLQVPGLVPQYDPSRANAADMDEL
jgi:exportin-1